MKTTEVLIAAFFTACYGGETHAQEPSDHKSENRKTILLENADKLQDLQQESEVTTADGEMAMRELATFQVRDKYLLRLYEKPEQMRFVIQTHTHTPIWTLYWLDATNRKTNQTRRVWSIYFPRDFSARPQWRPHGFAFGTRNEDVVALAFLDGSLPKIGFHEIDLTQIVEAAKPIDQPARPGAAYASPEASLRSIKSIYWIVYGELLSESYGEEKTRALMSESDRRIKNVVWTDGHWNVTLLLGADEFTFVREGDDPKWTLQPGRVGQAK